MQLQYGIYHFSVFLCLLFSYSLIILFSSSYLHVCSSLFPRFSVLFCLLWSFLSFVSFILNTCLKCWIHQHKAFVSFVKELGRDIYDLYAEYEDEEEEDRFPVSPSPVLLSPAKHFTLNINVGGTVTLLGLYHKRTAWLDMSKTRLPFCY